VAALTGNRVIFSDANAIFDKARIGSRLRVYAIGDIHGCSVLFDRILERIEADLGRNPAKQVKIVTVGDYSDRGPDSSGVIERLVARSADERFVMLRGNHEQWLLDFVENPLESGSSWMRNGGRETARSYGVEIDWDQDPYGFWRAFRRALPTRHLQFLQGLPFSHSEGDFLFVHAGIKPGVRLNRQSPRDMMWIRDEFLYHTGSFGKIVVHGHTPGEAVEILPNRINIDTRAFDSGVLSCVAIEGGEVRIIDTGRK
jgi:serine/threonine protein phosphatase 1